MTKKLVVSAQQVNMYHKMVLVKLATMASKLIRKKTVVSAQMENILMEISANLAQKHL